MITVQDILNAAQVVASRRSKSYRDDGYNEGFGYSYPAITFPSVHFKTREINYFGGHSFDGEVLEELGVDLPDPKSSLNWRKVGTLVRELGIDIEPDALYLLSLAQEKNDSGRKWRHIYKDLLGEYAEMVTT